MADRKMTVLNPAGYQEILQTDDELIVDSNTAQFSANTEVGFFGVTARAKYEATEQSVTGVLESIRLALNSFGLTDIDVEGDYTDDLNDLIAYLQNPIDIVGKGPIVVTEPTTPSRVSSITIGGATSNKGKGTYKDVATENASAGGNNSLDVSFDVDDSGNISDIVIEDGGDGYIIGETFELQGHGASTQMTVASVGVNLYTISVKDATDSSKGVVQVGSSLSVTNGVISADIAKTNATGVVSVGTGLSVTDAGVLSVNAAADDSRGTLEVATEAELIAGTTGNLAVVADRLRNVLNENADGDPNLPNGADNGYTIDCGVYHPYKT